MAADGQKLVDVYVRMLNARDPDLVDGFVAGIWSVAGGALTVAPFRRLSDVDAAAVLDEAGRLREFLQVDAVVRLDQV